MSNEQSNLTLSDIILVNKCQLEVDKYKCLHNIIWNGVNKYYLYKAKRQNISEADLNDLRNTLEELLKVIEPIMTLEPMDEK